MTITADIGRAEAPQPHNENTLRSTLRAARDRTREDISKTTAPTLPDGARRVLTAARDLITEHGWCRGRLRDPEGRLSLVGATLAVPRSRSEDVLNAQHRLLAASRLHTALDADAGLPPTGLDRAPDRLIAWNNSPGRTVDEVLDLINRALGEAVNQSETQTHVSRFPMGNRSPAPGETGTDWREQRRRRATAAKTADTVTAAAATAAAATAAAAIAAAKIADTVTAAAKTATASATFTAKTATASATSTAKTAATRGVPAATHAAALQAAAYTTKAATARTSSAKTSSAKDDRAAAIRRYIERAGRSALETAGDRAREDNPKTPKTTAPTLPDGARRVLTATRDLITEHGWCQGTFRDHEGRMCLVGALRHALRSRNGGPWGLGVGDAASNEHMLEAQRRLLAAGPAAPRLRPGTSPGGDTGPAKMGPAHVESRLMSWNDSPGRTVNEVLARIDRALAVGSKTSTDRRDDQRVADVLRLARRAKAEADEVLARIDRALAA